MTLIVSHPSGEKRKGFCALISIDIRNAFNTARWKNCIEVMVQKKVPDYLLRMIDDYPSNRWVIYDGEKWSLKEEMTCGAPQGSRVGPLIWNVMYDDSLHLELPSGTRTNGFADDALVVCAAEDVRAEALLVRDMRSSEYPKIVLGEHEVEWKISIKYLGGGGGGGGGSWIEGLASANTFSSQLLEPSNVVQT